MKWANFLHFYQPANQQPDILASIVDQSYRPLIEGIKKDKNLRLTINISGTLFELFEEYGYKDLIQDIKELVTDGRVEITGSAKYHPLLSLISKEEIKRQIELNNETLRKFLGDYTPKGFFPPEMAIDDKTIAAIEELGFEWIVLDEIACGGNVGQVDYSQVYKITNSRLKVFFRDRRLSNLIMSAVVRSRETLIEAMDKELKSTNYIVTAMDAETFGHHRPGLEQMLFDVWATPEFEFIQLSDIEKSYPVKKDVAPAATTWASSKADIEKGVQFLSWRDPENIIHKWQWELTDMVLGEVYKMDKTLPRYELVRSKMDRALASDHLWWASAKPWWSLEMIEYGAYILLDTLRHIPDVKKEILDKGSDYYEKIISTAFNWQRTGKIRSMMQSQNSILRIPFKDRTLERPGAENVYYAFLGMMEKLKKEAAERGEYEQAILWRDSIFKLDHKLDIYDTMNAIDLVRLKIPHKEVEETIVKYEAMYKKMRGGQPEQRGS